MLVLLICTVSAAVLLQFLLHSLSAAVSAISSLEPATPNSGLNLQTALQLQLVHLVTRDDPDEDKSTTTEDKDVIEVEPPMAPLEGRPDKCPYFQWQPLKYYGDLCEPTDPQIYTRWCVFTYPYFGLESLKGPKVSTRYICPTGTRCVTFLQYRFDSVPRDPRIRCKPKKEDDDKKPTTADVEKQTFKDWVRENTFGRDGTGDPETFPRLRPDPPRRQRKGKEPWVGDPWTASSSKPPKLE